MIFKDSAINCALLLFCKNGNENLLVAGMFFFAVSVSTLQILPFRKDAVKPQ